MAAEELREVRDELLTRLQQVEAAREDLLEELRELWRLESQRELEAAPRAVPSKPHSTSLAGARVRWVGGV